MVLSLVDFALISISNGLKDGTIQNPHMLPPNLRQHVLDMVLKRGLVNDPKCLALLTSIDFLNGMTSISTQAGEIYDVKFVQRLIDSMAAILPNGQTVGAAIKKLDLNVFGCYVHDNHRLFKKSTYPMVSQLIANCPNVTSLGLCGVRSDGPLEGVYNVGIDEMWSLWVPCLLNENSACTHVLENLTELSVSNWGSPEGDGFLVSGRPIVINFKRLTKLKLDDCRIDINVWPDFLRNIPTLEYLQMIDVQIGEKLKGLDKFVPFSMPHLKSLKITEEHPYWRDFKCNKVFVDNLMGCPELGQVQLMLNSPSADEASLIQLASMDIPMKIIARLSAPGDVGYADDETFDSSSKFKIARIFHEKIDSINLFFCLEWKPHFSTALEDVVSTCLNLTSFRIDIRYARISGEDMKRINAAMVLFFSSSQRALQLKDLRMSGNFNEAVMSAVFENCLNLDELDINYWPALRDQYLIDWVSRDGGKLTKFGLRECQNVTSEGIIPILVRSAEKLLRIFIHVGESSGERNWRVVLNNRCPNAQKWWKF